MLHTSSGKKVGILTLPLTHNYGGILQCVALQKVLVDLGCDVLILDRKYPEPFWKRTLKKTLFGFSFAEIERFKTKHFKNISEPIRTSEGLKEAVLESNIEAVVVGSDQIWREQYVSGFSLDYFLESLSEIPIKKIAYAASFGTGTIRKPVSNVNISDLLKKFSGISVRETSGLKILEENFNIHYATQALDPTLLLPSSFYESISAEAKTPPSKKTLAVYLLDETEEKLTQINQVAETMGLSVVQICHQPTHTLRRIFQQKKDVAHWLQTIQNAEVVITDSYHGMLFSILFKKQFVVWVNNKRGATRFNSIAKQLGLQDRLVQDLQNTNIGGWYTEIIDYKTVYSKLETLQEASLAFLKTNLSI